MLIVILFLLVPCTSAMTVQSEEKIKTSSDPLSYLIPIYGWEKTKINSLINKITNPDTKQKTTAIFDRCVQNLQIDIKETDEVVYECSCNGGCCPDEDIDLDDIFMNTEAWGWYKARLGWVYEASEKIYDLYRFAMKKLYDLTTIPFYLQFMDEEVLNQTNNTIDYFKRIINNWRNGILNLKDFTKENLQGPIDNITSIFNYIKDLVSIVIEDEIELIQDEITEFQNWLATEPWMKPINFFGTVYRKNKDQKVTLRWGVLSGQPEEINIPTLDSINTKKDVPYKITYNTLNAKNPKTAHIIDIKATFHDSPTENTSELRWCWAFGNASVEINFGDDSDDDSRLKSKPFFREFLLKNLLIRLLAFIPNMIKIK